MVTQRRLTRRHLLAGSAVGALSVGFADTLAVADPYDKPFSGFAPPSTVLREAPPAAVGLDPAPIAEASRLISSHQVAADGGHPLYPGAVCLMGHSGAIVATHVSGRALRYADAATELPADEQVAMRRETIFDLASVSKLFTSIAVVQLIEQGRVELAAPVARYLPEFAANGKSEVTIQQLLTHTSGFTSWLPLYSRYPDIASRIAAVMNQPLSNPAGTVYLYSDLNLITLGVLVERLTGSSLDEVVRARITAPLGLTRTGYNPADHTQTAATEYQVVPDRGLVWGQVHDENAWSFGGVAGHAGVFSTVDDLAILCQALLNGGIYRKNRILSAASVTSMITNFNADFPGDDHGLGFELNQLWYMSGLTSPRTAGHTGYTGTSLVIDFDSRSFAIVLTNRVHPSRDWGSVNVARREWAQGLALALPVRLRRDHQSWYTGNAEATTSTLTAAVPVGPGGGRLAFALFCETEATDRLNVSVSTDDGGSFTGLAWELTGGQAPVEVDASGSISGSLERTWWRARAILPADTTHVRWTLVTDAVYLGRGVHVDAVTAVGVGTGRVIDSERSTAAFTADGWSLVTS